ncbi:MAG: Lar family restriction alleviation protein [Oscillospiraceae bacterium]|nr:Lar family restriction alleviation protein [Oscillospiraceae bacterium]
MADNRIYLKCKDCGATFFLGKRFQGEYYTEEYAAYNGVPMTDRINKFYEDHYNCGGNGVDNFELEYEDTQSYWPEEVWETSDDLKPCPFCGRKPIVEKCVYEWFISCKCGIVQDKLYRQRCDAIKAWNRRKG